uniref:Uncharacterized protein n=1 Tax=Romanomermis culicivorax TaxID=13658 RepID=A0A915IQY3_ROMCU
MGQVQGSNVGPADSIIRKRFGVEGRQLRVGSNVGPAGSIIRKRFGVEGRQLRVGK